MLIDFPKDIYNSGKDILLLKESNTVIESIRNYIETDILDVPLTTNTSISARSMLLKATTQIELRSIVFDIKTIIEENIAEVKSCEVSYVDNNTTRTITLEIVLQGILGNDKNPTNVIIKV